MHRIPFAPRTGFFLEPVAKQRLMLNRLLREAVEDRLIESDTAPERIEFEWRVDDRLAYRFRWDNANGFQLVKSPVDLVGLSREQIVEFFRVFRELAGDDLDARAETDKTELECLDEFEKRERLRRGAEPYEATTQRLADCLGVDRRTVERRHKRGELPGVERTGRNRWVIQPDSDILHH